MRITVLGSGYVGLVTAAGFAELGHSTLAVDIDEQKVARLREGHVPFYEPGLSEIVTRATKGRRLEFSTRIAPPYDESDLYFIAVGTPPRPSDGRADTTAVEKAADGIAKVAKRAGVVVVKSTVPVGTCDALEDRIRSSGRTDLHVASNPEFLKEGAALEDFFRPDRVVVGVAEASTEQSMRDLYRPLQLSSERLLVTDRRTSELSKYASNAMLAVRISFVNELARLCDKVGADVSDVRRAMGMDRRIGPYFLYAGPGYGGSCFPKDTLALAGLADDVDVDLGVVRAAIEANERQRAYVLERVLSLFPAGLAGKTIAIWGLAFKPETDDVRDAPAAYVISGLLERGATIRAHDPEAAANFAKTYGLAVEYLDNEYDAAKDADAVLVMTEWRHFRNPDFVQLKKLMRQPKLVDARNIWSIQSPADHGFEYVGIGTRAGRGG